MTTEDLRPWGDHTFDELHFLATRDELRQAEIRRRIAAKGLQPSILFGWKKHIRDEESAFRQAYEPLLAADRAQPVAEFTSMTLAELEALAADPETRSRELETRARRQRTPTSTQTRLFREALTQARTAANPPPEFREMPLEELEALASDPKKLDAELASRARHFGTRPVTQERLFYAALEHARTQPSA